jgi:hypothetical protein
MIAIECLLAGALGELDGDVEREVDEHILSCGSCAATYTSLVRLGPEIAALVRAGNASMPITRTLADRLEREGLVTRRYLLTPGAIVPCTVGAEDIYSLTTLEADLSKAQRVDLIRGEQRISNVPFDGGAVRLLTSAEVIRSVPTMKLPFRLVAVDAGGHDRLIAEYTLDHTAPVP